MADTPEAFSFLRNIKPEVRGNHIESERLFFDGLTVDSPLADWARVRGQDFGETIVPRQVYVVGKNGKPHTVAWLHRSGMNFQTGTDYSYHHLACDCMPEAELDGDLSAMFACDSLITAVVGRAQQIRAEFALPELLPAKPSDKLATVGKQLVISTMLYILERDRLHPETWMANYLDGQHELSLLSVILNRETEELALYASMLEEAGELEVKSRTTIALSEDVKI